MQGILFIACARRNLCGFVFGHEFDSRQLHHIILRLDLFGRIFIIITPWNIRGIFYKKKGAHKSAIYSK